MSDTEEDQQPQQPAPLREDEEDEEEEEDAEELEDDKSNSDWFYMPDSVMLSIFQYLNPRELLVIMILFLM